MRMCADDFGLNHPVSTGILHLIQAKKINSVSCLVTTDCWNERKLDLQPFFKTVEVGLHLTLTKPKPVHFSGCSLSSLIRKSYLGGLKKEEMFYEIQTQIEIFKDTVGRLPDYVDGHEFCHQFPVVREALVEVAEKFHFRKNKVYIRVFRTGKLSFLSNGVFWIFNHLASLPSKKLSMLLKDKGISFNSRLFGFHPYHWKPEKYFDYYLQTRPSEKDIFFCHPGLPSNDESDSLRHYRPQIYNFMMSSQFDDMLNRYHIRFAR